MPHGKLIPQLDVGAQRLVLYSLEAPSVFRLIVRIVFPVNAHDTLNKRTEDDNQNEPAYDEAHKEVYSFRLAKV